MDPQGPPSSVDVSNPEGPTPDPGESPGAEAPPLHRINARIGVLEPHTVSPPLHPGNLTPGYAQNLWIRA
ncbi:hypothetical protein FRAHR75_1240017 [Frankia sp. Hr75.2]|nr:hypothetical protein FRAHR75_1240017 [Frankia sp. Hr75.2]